MAFRRKYPVRPDVCHNKHVGALNELQASLWLLKQDDPTGTYPSSAGPTVFQSSQTGSSANGTLAGGSSNAIGNILMPIAAWRVTNNSTGGTVTVTALQAGIG
jgi:hypothetical protein